MTTESYGIGWFSRLQRSRISRSLLSIPLALIFFTSFAFAQDNVIELSNADILAMIRDKLPAEVIVTKIQTSRCHFDTFPTVISELRYKGVAEEILVAMVEAPIGRPSKRVEKERTRAPVTSSVSAASTEKASTGSVTNAQTENATTESVRAASREKAATGSVIDAPTKKPGAVVVSPEPTEKRPAESAIRVSTDQPKQVLTSQQVLTNADVIKLLRSGLTTRIIATTIKSAPGDYDFSAKALIELQQAGADAAVFLSMMEVSKNASSTDNKTPGAGTSGATSLQNKKPEQKSDQQETSKPD